MKLFTKITGDKAVDKMLNGLSDKKLKTILIRSLKKIARPIVGSVKNQIAADGMNKTGSFKRSIKLIKSKDKNPSIIVGSKHSIFKFPTLLEYGNQGNDVSFEGRRTFDKVYSSTKTKAMNDIEKEVINLINKKIK
tara:strand:- start:646 stop:1053 length:408 start_codon:yes stop_codon:yes gene_type:complete